MSGRGIVGGCIFLGYQMIGLCRRKVQGLRIVYMVFDEDLSTILSYILSVRRFYIVQTDLPSSKRGEAVVIEDDLLIWICHFGMLAIRNICV